MERRRYNGKNDRDIETKRQVETREGVKRDNERKRGRYIGRDQEGEEQKQQRDKNGVRER